MVHIPPKLYLYLTRQILLLIHLLTLLPGKCFPNSSLATTKTHSLNSLLPIYLLPNGSQSPETGSGGEEDVHEQGNGEKNQGVDV